VAIPVTDVTSNNCVFLSAIVMPFFYLLNE